MFKELQSHHKIPEIESEILQFWDENSIFEKSIESRDPKNRFVFYEGPPTANGRPGIHHVLARTIKDFVCRLKTMQGFRVERKAGWDTHGLPVEIEVEKELGIEGKEGIVEYGIDKFNQKCKKNVFKYKKEWDELTRRIAFWVDLDNPYVTYSNEYIESVWWILKEFWKKDLLYEDYKILPYCPRCETALSSHEVSLGYKEVSDPSIYVKMKLKEGKDTHFLVWTTTPWTLISNVAIAVDPDVTYVKIEHNGENLILAEARLSVINGEFTKIAEYRGSDLIDWEYEPIFNYLHPKEKAWYVIPGDFVTTEDGTGIVHIAPAFGEDDYAAGRKFNLPVLQPVDKNGRFSEEITDFKGQFVKDADPHIISSMKKNGKLYFSETIIHSYPFCWRCDSALLYYAKKSWYIRTTAKKDNLLAANKQIQWVPKEVGTGRFGEWLSNNVDWALSRDRFWGTPLNIWRCDSCEQKEVIGSKQELLDLAQISELDDLHKPYIDEVKFPCKKCQGTMVRYPEVIDVWFDSGAMPYAQWHYPFENKEIFDQSFPANFISEGIDQTRGWFYSLLAISTLLFDKPAYTTCLSHDLILDKEGQKMSKTKGNSVNPFEILDKYGSDPLRWYLITVSPPWVPTRFDVQGVLEVHRKFFGTLLNTYSFFVIYANIDDFCYQQDPIPVEKRPEIDRWIFYARNRLVKKVNEYLDRYEITRASRLIADFTVEELSNWYVRRCRRRFWKSEMGEDKLSAYQTLFEVLITLTKLIAPLTPFVAEAIYRNLNIVNYEPYESVHLAQYPHPSQPEYQYTDDALVDRMATARDVVTTARALRNEAGIKVRQPLSRIVAATKSAKLRDVLHSMQDLIIQEINVKTLEVTDNPEQLFVLRAKPKFKSLGPKFGADVNKVAGMVEKMTPDEVKQLKQENRYDFAFEGQETYITLEDVEVETLSPPNLVLHSENELTIGLDLVLTEELREEGIAREFVNRIQNMRKDAGYDVTDRINICFEGSEDITLAVSNCSSYIKNETLAERLDDKYCELDYSKQWSINDLSVSISIIKIS